MLFFLYSCVTEFKKYKKKIKKLIKGCTQHCLLKIPITRFISQPAIQLDLQQNPMASHIKWRNIKIKWHVDNIKVQVKPC